MSTLDMSEMEISNMIFDMLINEYNYPRESIELEVPKSLHNARFIADIVIYENNEPYILVEVKNTKFNLIRGIEQLEKITEAIKPHFSILTNGIDFKFYEVITDGFSISLNEIPDIPRHGEKLDEEISYSRNDLFPLSTDRYLTMMWRHFDILRNEAFPPYDSFKYLLLLYATKYNDEKTGAFQFNAISNPDQTRNLVLRLANELRNPDRYIEDVRIPFSARNIELIAYDLQRISLVQSASQFRTILPKIISRFDNQLDFYTTPDIIAELITELINPQKNKILLDPASGLGGFLVKLAAKGTRVEGIELSRETANLANLILMLSGVEGSVTPGNSLQIPQESYSKYDYVVSSPPFGQTITESMYEYQLFNPNSRTFSEELFLEATLKYLKQGGTGVIHVPNGFLFHGNFSEARKYLLEKTVLKAVIKITPDLYNDWFRVTSSLLIFEKSTKGTSNNYPVFFATLTENNFDEIVTKYHEYQNGITFENGENIILSTIKTADNLDFDYIKGQLYFNELKTSDFIELGRVVDFISGASINRAGEKDDNGSHYYIRATNIGDGIVETSEAERINVSEKSRYLMEPNDVLISRAGTVGKAALVRNEQNLIAGSNVVILRTKDDRISPEYLLGFVMSDLGKRQLEMYTSGTTISHINTSNLAKIRIPLQDVSSQQNVVSLLENFVSLKKEEEELLNTIQEKRKKILAELNAAFEEVI
ncbi:MAG: N-6 DNA methylase [Candidatus Hodarchaeales archaeon]